MDKKNLLNKHKHKAMVLGGIISQTILEIKNLERTSDDEFFLSNLSKEFDIDEDIKLIRLIQKNEIKRKKELLVNGYLKSYKCSLELIEKLEKDLDEK